VSSRNVGELLPNYMTFITNLYIGVSGTLKTEALYSSETLSPRVPDAVFIYIYCLFK
jgi:hypothetical protein